MCCSKSQTSFRTPKVSQRRSGVLTFLKQLRRTYKTFALAVLAVSAAHPGLLSGQGLECCVYPRHCRRAAELPLFSLNISMLTCVCVNIAPPAACGWSLAHTTCTRFKLAVCFLVDLLLMQRHIHLLLFFECALPLVTCSVQQLEVVLATTAPGRSRSLGACEDMKDLVAEKNCTAVLLISPLSGRALAASNQLIGSSDRCAVWSHTVGSAKAFMYQSFSGDGATTFPGIEGNR